MTTDDLRQRKRELLARKKYEEERLARGEGDKLVLYEVREELDCVSTQLRELTGKGRRRARDTRSPWQQDRQQALEWQQREQSLDEEIEAGRRQLRAAATDSLDTLRPAQRQALELYTAGLTVSEIAHKLGVGVSTVSRNLSRARKHAAEAVARALEAEHILAGTERVDLTDSGALKAVVLAMTAKQLIYFYLYYSEGLTLREIEALTGVDHASVSRTVLRARLKLDRLFGGADVVLDHPEVLDEAAYLVYCRLEDHPEELPERFRPAAYRPPSGRGGHCPGRRGWTALTPSHIRIARAKRVMPGKLLALFRGRTNGLLLWLETTFRYLQKFLKGA